MFRLAIAEIVGTFIIVFLGTGSMVVNDITNGDLTHVGVCLIWGLSVFIAITLTEKISDGHFNPSVSLVMLLRKEVSLGSYFFRFFFQLIGALLASIVLHILFPMHTTLGATLPKLASWYVFLIELLISCFLMSVILVVGRQKRPLLQSAGWISVAVIIAALLAGPYTGASMNPARTLGPGIVSGTMTGLWIYLTAPVVGMLIAMPVDRLLARTFR